jgi:hypothetical protein
MSTTEYNEVASWMRGEGRQFFDQMTIRDIARTETNLNLDSVIIEMRELAPHVGTTLFVERSDEILGRYGVALTIYDISSD